MWGLEKYNCSAKCKTDRLLNVGVVPLTTTDTMRVKLRLRQFEILPQVGQKDAQQHEQKHKALQQSLQQAQLQNSNLQQAFEDAQRAQQASASRVSSVSAVSS